MYNKTINEKYVLYDFILNDIKIGINFYQQANKKIDDIKYIPKVIYGELTENNIEFPTLGIILKKLDVNANTLLNTIVDIIDDFLTNHNYRIKYNFISIENEDLEQKIKIHNEKILSKINNSTISIYKDTNSKYNTNKDYSKIIYLLQKK